MGAGRRKMGFHPGHPNALREKDHEREGAWKVRTGGYMDNLLQNFTKNLASGPLLLDVPQTAHQSPACLGN